MIPVSGSISVVTTGTAGLAYSGTAGPFTGKFWGVSYTSDSGTSDFISTTALMKIEGAETGIVYMTSATPVGTGAVYWPRTPVDTDTGGSALEGTTGEQPAQYDYLPVVAENIQLTIYNTSTVGQLGTFLFIVEGTNQ